MTAFEWTNALSVGDDLIDHDHQDLFTLVREVSDSDLNDGFLMGLLERLEHYTQDHFAREEEYMLAYGFPGLEDHKAKHALFVEWLDTVRRTYTRAPQTPFMLAEQVNSFLKEWLISHIMHEDMKYRDFMLEQKRNAQS